LSAVAALTWSNRRTDRLGWQQAVGIPPGRGGASRAWSSRLVRSCCGASRSSSRAVRPPGGSPR